LSLTHITYVYSSITLAKTCLTIQDKRLKVSLNGNRRIIGVLRGYDAFLNVVLEEAENELQEYLGQIVVRGNSIIQFEALERVQA
jgi:small nuclear ribonucleoprotein G